MGIDWGSVFGGGGKQGGGAAPPAAPVRGTGKINWGSMFTPAAPPPPRQLGALPLSNNQLHQFQSLYASATPDVQKTIQDHIEQRYKANPNDTNAKQQYQALFGANKALLDSGAKPEALPETSSIGQSQQMARAAGKGVLDFGTGLVTSALGEQVNHAKPNTEADLSAKYGKTAKTLPNVGAGKNGNSYSDMFNPEQLKSDAATAITDRLFLGQGGAIIKTARGLVAAKFGADQLKQLPDTVKILKDPNVPQDEKIRLATQALLATGMTIAGLKHAATEGAHGVNEQISGAKNVDTIAKLGALDKLVKGGDSEYAASGKGLPAPTETKALPAPSGKPTILQSSGGEPITNEAAPTSNKRVAAIDKQLTDFKTNPHTTMTPNDAKTLQQERFKLTNQPALDHIANDHAVAHDILPEQAHADLQAGYGTHAPLYKQIVQAKEPILANERGGLPIEKIPGVGDVARVAKDATAAGKELIDHIHPQLDPQAKDIFYGARGEADYAKYKATGQLSDAKKYFNGATTDHSRNFVQAIMDGKTEQLPAVEQKHAALIDSMLSQQLAKEQPYLKTAEKVNYFPTSGIWDKSPDAGKLAAEGTIGGNKSFLKNKVWADLAQGEAAGGTLRKDFNPVDLVQRRIYEGTKAMELVKGLEEAKKTGLAVQESELKGASAADRSAALSGKVQVKDPALKGWWVQPDLAKMIERHNSSNWFTDSNLGRGISAVKNSGTAIKLGLSAAHAVQSTIGGIYDHMGLGLQKLLSPRGSGVSRLGGLGDIATSPMAPVRAVIKEIGGFSDKEMRDYFTGGGKKGADAQYKEGFGSAARAAAEGEYIRAGLKGASSVNHALLSPLFEHYIPDLKITSVADRIAYDMQVKAGDIASGKTSAREIARNAVKQADQTFGEYNYDNLHMNNTLKGTAQFATRALGWTYGNLAQLTKGAVKTPIDLVRVPYGLITGKGGGLSPEAAKLWSLAFTVGTVGAIYQHAHTGQWPNSAQDFFEPKNGQKDNNGKDVRITFLNPINDALSIKRNVSNYGVVGGTGKFLAGKEADALSIMSSLFSNKDYLGNYVYDPKAGWQQKGTEIASYVGGSLKPISLTNAQDKTSNVSPTEGFFGINKASSLDSRTPLENMIFQGLTDKLGSNPKTPVQVRAAKDKAAALADIRSGKTSSANIDKLRLTLSPEDFKKVKTEGGQSQLAYDFSLLNNDQKVNILEKTNPGDLKKAGISADTLVKDLLTDRATVDSLTSKGITPQQMNDLIKNKLGYSGADFNRILKQNKDAAKQSREQSKTRGKFVPFLK